jgi:hypothetical protein
MGLGSVLSTATAPLNVARALTDAVRNLDDIARGVGAMHGEFLGMRKDIHTLTDEIRGLRIDVNEMGTGVAGIHAACEQLDVRVEDLAGSLESVNVLASRLGRFGGRRGRSAPSAES